MPLGYLETKHIGMAIGLGARQSPVLIAFLKALLYSFRPASLSLLLLSLWAPIKFYECVVMLVLRFFVISVLLCVVAGCKLSPPDSETNTGVLALEITMTSPNRIDSDSFPNSDEVTISVRLVDANNAPQAAQIVKVSTSLGTLTTGQLLTNAEGVAITKISPSELLGAGVITASFGEKVTATKNFELLGALPPIPPSKPKLSVSMSSPLQVDSESFPNSDQVTITVLLVDANNLPIKGEVVKLASTLGTLSVDQILTDSLGKATAKISPSDGLGAGIVTATFGDLSTKFNFELLASAPPPTPAPKITITMSSPMQVDSDSFPNSDEVTITAILVDANNIPIKGEILKVTTSLGSLLSEDLLTDTLGKATTKISPSAVMGAGALAATFGIVTAKYNFELLAPLPPPVVSKPKIALSLLRSGLPITRFKSNEVAQLQALVTDENNMPLANKIVKFTVELGTTDVATGLTNQSGVAQVNLSSDNTKLGAAEASASVSINSVNLTSSVNYEIIDSAITVTEQITKLGYFNNSNLFVENKLGSSIAPDVNGDINISAGGTLGISLALVDENNQRVMTPTQVNFSSVCVGSQKARIGASVFTVNGVANTTYEDISCGGSQDAIQATVTVNNQTKSLSQTVRIAPENIGSIEFISASPESIVLKGTGGQGLQETSTLTFLVKGTLGNPLAQQPVTFSLNTSAGNLTITPASSITNSSGLVTTKVNAGNVPTAVRVTASVTTASSQVIQTQSDLLSVNTGMPDQDSFSLATEKFNPEAGNYDGTEVVISARLADAFNNPVPDGTSINFTTEGGSIVPTCNTLNGACTVKWTSGEPRVASHRITILATAVGHETFFDTNGSNTFDVADGVAFTSNFDSGFGRISPAASGFWDMSEAWRDDNENLAFDSGEKFIDFDNNQIFGVADGLFNGPQCQGSLCGLGSKASLHVRKSLVMIMSSSNALLTLASARQFDGSNSSYPHLGGAKIYESNVGGLVMSPSLTLAEDASEQFTLYLSDDGLPFGQVLPVGTTISIEADKGTLSGTTNFEVPNTSGGGDPSAFSGNAISFFLTNSNSAANAGDSTLNGVLKISATTPKGTITTIFLPYTLTGS
jgi:hypothetical protein